MNVGQRDLSYRQHCEQRKGSSKSPSWITRVVNWGCALPWWKFVFRPYCERLHINQQTLTLPTLPTAFDGYQILFLSDLHLDIVPNPLATLLTMTMPSHDLVILGGDYFDKSENVDETVLRALVECFDKPIYAVLGNHDRSDMIELLESLGVHVLVNQSVILSRDQEEILLTGIDDVSQFNNGEQARFAQAEGARFSGCKWLISHTPDFLDRAADAGYSLQLSGHTHGGQLTLFGHVVFKQTKFHFAVKGPWAYRDLQGITSTGVGSSRYPVRNIAPEVVRLTLRSQ